VLGRQFLSLNMGNLWNQGRKFSKKEKPIEKVEEERGKTKLRMSKCRILEEVNPIFSGIDVVVVSPPSPKVQRKSSIETNPINISSRKVVVDD
jgi:hypothetical protein